MSFSLIAWVYVYIHACVKILYKIKQTMIRKWEDKVMFQAGLPVLFRPI